jgi:hypothetical protein
MSIWSCSGGDEHGEGEWDERVSAHGWYQGIARRGSGSSSDGSDGEFLERFGEHLADVRDGEPSADQAADRELVAGEGIPRGLLR